MVSLEELVDAERSQPPCQVHDWYEELPKALQQSFDRLVEINTPTAQLHRACLKLDPPVPVGYAMFRKHVRGLCRRP